MRLLTWMPRDLRDGISAIDPARNIGEDQTVSADALVARAEGSEDQLILNRPEGRPTRLPRRGVAPAAVAAVIVVLAVGAVLVGRPSSNGPTGAAASTGATSSSPPVSGTGPTLSAARMWAAFPVTASPRPIVLIGQSVVFAEGAFPDGDTKIAFLEGRVNLAATAPASPGARDGYPIDSAATAVIALTAPVTAPPAGGYPLPPILQITSINLSEHLFLTDRGEQSLPAWRMHLDGIDGQFYVLAVAPAGRFSSGPGSGSPDRPAAMSADGKEITIPFVAHQDPAGICDPGFTSTLHLAQTPTAVVAATTTVAIPAPTPTTTPSGSGVGIFIPDGGGPVQYFCDFAGRGFGSPPHEPLTPGEANTRTITLTEPLGNRVLVDGAGLPFAVVTSS